MADDVVGNPVIYLQAWNWIFEIEGIQVAGFEEVGPFKTTHQIVVQRQGGQRRPVAKRPGTYDVENIVCKRGASDNDELWQWHARQKQGIKDPRNCSLVCQDEDGAELVRFKVTAAVIAEFDAGTFDAKKGSENVIESITLAHLDHDREAA